MRLVFVMVTFGLLFAALGCSGGGDSSEDPTATSAGGTRALEPGATEAVATVEAGGATAVAEATQQAGAATPAPDATREPGRGSPAVPAPVPTQELIIDAPPDVTSGEPVRLAVRMVGESVPFAAFNFDIVYDQRLVELEAPEANVDGLNTGGREFQCALPPSSGDVDPDPDVGRARLVCFSFGGEDAAAPVMPMTVAHVTLHGTAPGEATLHAENVALYGPDASAIPIGASSVRIVIE